MSPRVYTECKSFGHMWDRDAPAPFGVRPAPKGWRQIHFRCLECTMIRRVRINMRTGETKNSYTKPPEYDAVKKDRRAWKIEFVRTHYKAPRKRRTSKS